MSPNASSGCLMRGLVALSLFAAVSAESIQFLNFDIQVSEIPGMDNPFNAFNHWINSLLLPQSVFDFFQDRLTPHQAHFAVTYFRDLCAATVMYYLVGGLWHLWIYNVRGEQYFIKQGAKMPTSALIWDQITLSQFSLFMYAGVPVLGEYFIEKGWTMCYWSIEEVGGWHMYALYTLGYFTLVEMGVYWMHRKLHTVKFLYKYVHGLHHKYNKPELLSPWCSIAFNPVDGCLQASPYVICLFLCPCHYLTHIVLLFCTAVWATNIHDALNADTEPIMGSKYHTKHHTHYHVNFGQYFIFCDWLWGTLSPPEDKGRMKLAPEGQKFD